MNGPVPFCTRTYLKQQSQRKTLISGWIAAGVPRWLTLTDEFLFLGASLIFVAGSFDFFPGTPLPKYFEGCQLFIVGSVTYLALALFATYEIVADARLEGSKPDTADLIEQALYVIGSALFVYGTFLFTPPLSEVTAAATSDAVVGTTEGARQLSVTFFGRAYDIIVSAGMPEPEPAEADVKKGDLLFAIGSILYSVAAFVSALRAAGGAGTDARSLLRRRTAIATASLYEIGGVCFIVGSLGYVPPGTIGISSCPDGVRVLETFGASLFVLGSAFYTLGAATSLAAVGWFTYNDEEVEFQAVDLGLAAALSAADVVPTADSPTSLGGDAVVLDDAPPPNRSSFSDAPLYDVYSEWRGTRPEDEDSTSDTPASE